MSQQSIDSTVTFEDVSDLHFDLENPRLVEFGITSRTSENEILETLWDAMDVSELALSMSVDGYFEHEPLIVTKEKGNLVVIEGNRRLAALKVLTQPELAAGKNWQVPDITQERKDSLQSVPVATKSRKDAWRYLGYKHVNGPTKWTSYAKAKYIAEVHRQYGIPLEDIARQIGDGHGTVKKIHRGLMVLEQAEKAGVYDREDAFTKRIYFSHLYTAVQYDGFAKFLGLAPKDDVTETPVSEGKLDELGEVCRWMFGSEKEKQPAIIKTQNPDLRRLDAVVANKEAVLALRAGDSLESAYLISRPSGDVLEEALLEAKRALMRAKSYVSTGYDKSEDLLKQAGAVANLADAVYDEMEKMRIDRRKRRISSDEQSKS